MRTRIFKLKGIIFFILLSFSLTATASNNSNISNEAAATSAAVDIPVKTLKKYIKQYIDAPPGSINWSTFTSTKITSIEGIDKDGYNYQYYIPIFSPPIKSLNGKTITIKGFMFPLDEKEKQTTFLFGPFPLSCPFQYHVTPVLVIEVHAASPGVLFSYDPVVITGTLQLVSKDPEYSTFYRLLNAKQVKQ